MSETISAQPRRILRLLPLNPDYGLGAFRRRVRLRRQGGCVQGVLDDNYHAMWLEMRHDGERVTQMQGGFHRPPTTGCLGAPDVLAELIGTSLAASDQELFAPGLAQRQCTHLYGLAALALSAATKPEDQRIWDVVVPDPRDDWTTATVTLNGQLIHEWRLHDYIIQPDDGSDPQKLLAGFAPWAAARWTGDDLEGAGVLRMAAFTARARAHVTDSEAWPLRQFPERRGACHAYTSPQVETALHRVGNALDFSEGLTESPWPGPTD